MAQVIVPIVGFASSVYQGRQRRKLKDQQAEGYQEASRRRMAAASREVGEEERNKDYMYSRALAVAAASGGGASGQGIVALFGDLNAEGEYRMLSRLYSGQDDAQGLQFRAEAARREGKAAEKAGWINGVVSAVSSYKGGFGSTSASPIAGPTAGTPIPGGPPSNAPSRRQV